MSGKEHLEKVALTPEEIEIIRHRRETGAIPDTHIVSSDMSVMRLKNKNTEMTRRYKHVMEQLEIAEERLGTLIDIRSHQHNRQITSKPVAQDGSATAVMVGSDWHIEEKVDPSTINNRNIFTPTIAGKRVEEFFRRGLFLTNLMRKGIRVNRVVLALLGDIITGYIHEELQEDNYLSPTEAILLGKELISSGIDFLLCEGGFEEIIIPCCIGNHGRTTKKMRISTAYKNSYEWLLYKTLEQEYATNTKVKFIVSNSYHIYLPVYDNFKVRFHHGDAIRYGGGVGGITIPVKKMIAKWNKAETVNLDVFGHFHQFMDGGDFISNGSLIGQNALGNMRYEAHEPQQAFFLIDAERGKVIVAPIFVA